MKNYRIVLQYEGTRYQGWQRQGSTENTIQGRLEGLLGKMTGQKVEIIGSGRTDAGVHAACQVANFHLDTEKTPEQIMDYMNAYLPEDIGVIEIKEVGERFHSRLNVKGKTYRYRVLNTKIPHVFDRRYVHVVEEPLDVAAMQKAASYLEGTHDFKAFTSSKRGKKSTVRTIESIRIDQVSTSFVWDREIRFTFSGNGFLYHMVRIMAGTLLEVGMHKRKPEEMADILAGGLREKAGACQGTYADGGSLLVKSSLTADEMRMRERIRGTDYPVMTQGKVRALFFVYLLIVIKLIIFKYPYSQLKAIVDTWEKDVILEGLDTANFTLFKTIRMYIDYSYMLNSFENLVGNVVVFIPFGFLLPYVLKRGRNFLVMLLNAFLFVLGIEVFQLFSAFGAFDVDDILLNCFGAVLGYFGYLIWEGIKKRIEKERER